MNLIIVLPIFYIGTYCLYRSARSLAPFTSHLEAPALLPSDPKQSHSVSRQAS